MADQTAYHAPSFGDDEFNMDQLGMRYASQQQQQHPGQQITMHQMTTAQQQQQQMQHQQNIQMQQAVYQPHGMMPSSESYGNQMDGAVSYHSAPQQQQQQQQPVYLTLEHAHHQQQQHQQFVPSTIAFTSGPTYTVTGAQQAPNSGMGGMPPPQGAQQIRFNPAGTTVIYTQQQQPLQQHQQQQPQQQSQLIHQQQQQTMNSPQMSVPHGLSSPGAMTNQQQRVQSPPGGHETGSEDSDNDGSHLGQGMLGRSPHEGGGMMPAVNIMQQQQLAAAAAAAKKPKAVKKKKKKDPNEPQKPVSAYALFFRDTQAAIKNQNPSASFGEVSKIVASMWDALDVEHKNVYKQKTEAAKKDYLKALAAYKATLVSRGDDEGESQQPAFQGYGSYGGGVSYATSGGNFTATTQGAPQAPQQQFSPTNANQLAQQQQNSQQQMGQMQGQLGSPPGAQYRPMGQLQQPQQQGPPSGPMLYSGQQPQQQMMSTPTRVIQPNVHDGNAPPGGPMLNQQQQPHPGGPSPHQQQQQQQQQNVAIPTAPQQVNNHTMNNHSSPPPGNQVPQVQRGPGPPQVQQQPANPQAGGCIRSGCPNLAIRNPEWEDEYCSNECVVSHCRDVFTNWVASNQQPQAQN